MIRQLNISGEQCPADFSIMTLAKIAREYDTDITGLATLAAGDGHLDEQLKFIATLGAEALNAGAERERLLRKYTVYDLYDALTEDLSLAETLLTAFKDTFEGSSVFPKPSTATAKKEKKK